MKSLEECKDYFNTNMMSRAVDAEKQRKKFVRYWVVEMTKTVLISAVIIIVGVIISSNLKDDGSLGFLLFKVAPLIGSIVWILIKIFTLGFKYLENMEAFRRYYRKQVTEPMLKFMLPELSYKPEEGIDTEIIENSFIVPIYFTRGDSVSKYLLQPHDLLEGDFGGVSAKASMLSLERRADRVQCDSSGGLFFQAKLQDEFEGGVVILREFTEKYLGENLSNIVDDIRTTLGKNDEKIYFNEDEEQTQNAQWQSLKRYQADDEEFEKYYRIKTSDIDLAKKLLTDKRISHMLEIAKAGNLLVQFSFYNGYYSAYFFRDNAHLFDVALEEVKNKVDNPDNMIRLHNELQVVYAMADEMLIE